MFLSKSIEFLKGVGPQRAELLRKELGIYQYEDLLQYYPFRYVDKSKVYKIAEVNNDQTYFQFKGKLIALNELGEKFKKRLVALVEDDSGTMELVWFKNYKFVKPNLKIGDEYFIFGKPSFFNGKFNISHPEIENAANKQLISRAPLQAIYSSGEKLSSRGLTSRGIEKLVYTLLEESKNEIAENIPDNILKKYNLAGRKFALENIHFPSGFDALNKAQQRLKFEELFFIQLQLVKQKMITTKRMRGFLFEKVGHRFNEFYEKYLPFPLTNAQKRVIKEIRKDMGSGAHMNRLLQGDVGSGKTVVALLIMLIAIDNGFQACIMAPTEILAQQHYNTITSMLAHMPVTVGLLTGSTKQSQRNLIHETLRSGALNILIGTHALLEPDVEFSNLGLAVVDEQHRFGVEQRARMWKKNKIPPHILVMTATPIPRTLAMTLYGDLDVSVIDEMPPGRKPIKTTHRFESARMAMFAFLEEQIKKGRQVYIVYPLIEESEKLNFKDLMDGYESISRRFPLPEYRVSIVHGKMTPQAKNHEMDLFVKGQTHIMVATTVIEVGVNVPNASVMVIESAEKFGLSQLHQLRGRVGRGAEESFCILMTGEKLGNDARARMNIMVKTNDGFLISEEDMRLRGPGDLAGTQQSGMLQMRIADITKDGEILNLARAAAIEIIESDPELTAPENNLLRQELAEREKNKTGWARIS